MQVSGYVCNACKSQIPEGKFVIYDDKAEQYYCDDDCFETWADNNSDDVLDFYRRLNTSYVQV